MGRLKERYAEQIEMDRRIAIERAEAEYFAIPEALHKSLEISEAHRSESMASYENLARENAELKQLLIVATGWQSRWKERGIGFAIGCAASVLASFVWLEMVRYWPSLR